MRIKTTSIQIPPELREKVEKQAKLESRSVSRMIVIILRKHFDAKD